MSNTAKKDKDLPRPAKDDAEGIHEALVDIAYGIDYLIIALLSDGDTDSKRMQRNLAEERINYRHWNENHR